MRRDDKWEWESKIGKNRINKERKERGGEEKRGEGEQGRVLWGVDQIRRKLHQKPQSFAKYWISELYVPGVARLNLCDEKVGESWQEAYEK